MSDSVRPFEDISTGLPGGPTACEASDAFVIETGTWSTPPAALTSPTRAAVSRVPNGLTPLNSFCARPSQKLRKLKTALMTDGVLRPVVRRTGVPPTLKSGSLVANVWSSAGSPAVTPLNADGNTPCEPDTFEVSERTADAASFGSASLWNGKSSAESWAFAPLNVNVAAARVDLVARAVVGAGVEVARRARRAPVGAGLHVPEQRLAELDRARLALDVRRLVRRRRHGRAVERREQRRGCGPPRSRCRRPRPTRPGRRMRAQGRSPRAARSAGRSQPKPHRVHPRR